MSRVSIRLEVEVPFEEWQAAVRAGDTGKFGAMLQTFRKRMLAEARRALPPEVRPRVSDSDLVQETCREAHEDFGRFQGRSWTDLWHWLLAVLRNNAGQATRRHLRARKRAAGKEVALDVWVPFDRLVDPDAAEPVDVLIRIQEIRAMASAVDRLPERERAAVLLKYRDECSFEEIGRRLGCSPSAARKAVTRGLGEIGSEIRGESDGQETG